MPADQLRANGGVHGGRRYLPYFFTEHGAVMAANVLNSEVAVQASIMLVRAFIRARNLIAEHVELKRRLSDLEQRVARGFSAHEEELQEIRYLLSQLEMPVEEKKRPIGFAREKDR